MATSQVDRAQSHGDQPTQPECVLLGRAMLATGEEFACTFNNVTVRSAEIVAAVSVEVGQVVVCYLDQFGLLPGKVSVRMREGFAVGFSLKAGRQERLAAQLESQSHHAMRNAELRRAQRIVPLHRSVEVRLAEDIAFNGTIINISMSGAAITLDAADIPFVGARVGLGGRFATVVRVIEGGIAVQFDVPFTPENFDERVRL